MRMHRIWPPIIMAALVLTASGSVDAAKPKPRPHHPVAPDPTRHLDMVFVTLLKSMTEKQIGDYTPQDGYTYLTVYLRVVNHNDVQQQVSDSDFTIVTLRGSSINEEASTLSPMFKTTVLDPGGTVFGYMTFQVAQADHHVVLRWQPAPGHTNENWPTVTWPIKY